MACSFDIYINSYRPKVTRNYTLELSELKKKTKENNKIIDGDDNNESFEKSYKNKYNIRKFFFFFFLTKRDFAEDQLRLSEDHV